MDVYHTLQGPDVLERVGILHTSHQPTQPTRAASHQVRGSVSLGPFEEKRGGAHVIPLKLPNLVFYGVFVATAKRRNLR